MAHLFWPCRVIGCARAGGRDSCSGFSIGAFGSSPPVTPTRSSSLSQGPCFSPRSTRWPPHDGVRRAGGTILQTSSPEAGGTSRYNELARPAVPAGRTSARSADLLSAHAFDGPLRRSLL